MSKDKLEQSTSPSLHQDAGGDGATLPNIAALDPDRIAIYRAQHVGSPADYARYFRGMDKSLVLKVAAPSAYFMPPPSGMGVIADMAFGSGSMADHLAALFSDSFMVVGIEIDETAIRHGRDTYSRPNLSFELGDIETQIFPSGSLDGIFNSSSGHHLTSFNQFDVSHIERMFDNHAVQLKDWGLLAFRDFVRPSDPAAVILHLRNNDGALEGEVGALSTSALFRNRFAPDFRSSTVGEEGVKYVSVESKNPEFDAFELSFRDANEFILRKDYRVSEDNWSRELQEEYTYFTSEQFIEACRSRGLRIILAGPQFNPWIIENRYKEKVLLSDKSGEEIPFPGTNYLLIARKVPNDVGVDFVEEGTQSGVRFSYCSLESYVNTETSEVFELVRRPNPAIDVIPWFEKYGSIFVMLNGDYPRPIINARGETPNLDQSYNAGYLTEPIAGPLDLILPTNGNVSRVLSSFGIDPEGMIRAEQYGEYLSAATIIDEKVKTVAVEIAPIENSILLDGSRSHLSTSGYVFPFDAYQYLRACQVGGIAEPRTERAVYSLLQRLGKDPGPWIASELSSSKLTEVKVKTRPFLRIPENRNPQGFVSIQTNEGEGFFGLYRGNFCERNSRGETLGQVALEYASPKNWSENTFSVLPVAIMDGEIVVGLERRDVPSSEIHFGNSNLVTVPSFRLPFEATDISLASKDVISRLKRDFGLEALELIPIGGKYYASPGALPEEVFPHIAIVNPNSVNGPLVHWTKLRDLVEHADKIRCGHLLTSAFRAAHALGLLSK